jgi:TATA-binding protein-associated factor
MISLRNLLAHVWIFDFKLGECVIGCVQDVICELTPLQRRLYEVATAGTDIDPAAVATATPPQSSAPVFRVLQRLRKLCTHPSLMLDLQDHSHVEALNDVFPSLDTHRRSAVDAELASIEQAPKLLALRQLLSNAGIIVGGSNAGVDGEADARAISGDSGQHRVLCFAQMKGSLDLVESVVLDPEGVSYLRLDGDVSPARRSDIVQQFNTDPTVEVMLLTTAAGCHGLNLTTANVVVFLEHDWNPMKDMQVLHLTACRV